MHLAATPNHGVANSRTLADAIGASRDHLGKILQVLSRVGLTKSVRGIRGGFALAKDPGEMTALDVYEAIDGPIRHASGDDPVSELIVEVGRGAAATLRGTRITDLLEPRRRSKAVAGHVTSRRRSRVEA